MGWVKTGPIVGGPMHIKYHIISKYSVANIINTGKINHEETHELPCMGAVVTLPD